MPKPKKYQIFYKKHGLQNKKVGHTLYHDHLCMVHKIGD